MHLKKKCCVVFGPPRFITTVWFTAASPSKIYFGKLFFQLIFSDWSELLCHGKAFVNHMVNNNCQYLIRHNSSLPSASLSDRPLVYKLFDFFLHVEINCKSS
jgi:hypothetical protein